jgi:hypothetical protein
LFVNLRVEIGGSLAIEISSDGADASECQDESRDSNSAYHSTACGSLKLQEIQFRGILQVQAGIATH